MLSFELSELSETESDEESEDGDDDILSDDETEVVNFQDSFESHTAEGIVFWLTFVNDFISLMSYKTIYVYTLNSSPSICMQLNWDF